MKSALTSLTLALMLSSCSGAAPAPSTSASTTETTGSDESGEGGATEGEAVSDEVAPSGGPEVASVSCVASDAAGRCLRCRGFIVNNATNNGVLDQATCRNMPPGARVAIRTSGNFILQGGPATDDIWLDANLRALGGEAHCTGDRPDHGPCGTASGSVGPHTMNFEVIGTVPASGDVAGTLSVTMCTGRAGGRPSCALQQIPNATVDTAGAPVWEMQVL